MATPFPSVASAEAISNLFPRTVDGITAAVAAAKEKATAALQTIYSIPEAERTFGNTALQADHAMAVFSTTSSIMSVVKSTSVEKEMRDAASKAVVELSEFSIDNFQTNRTLFKAFEFVANKKAEMAKAVAAAASEESGSRRSYWMGDTMDSFLRNGLGLPDAEFDKAVELKKAISKLSTEFDRNIAEDKTCVEFSEEELKGVPPSVLGGITRDEKTGTFQCKMDYPTFFGIMRNCEVAETRKKMAIAFDQRAYPVNIPVLHSVIAKRHQLASLLGFASYAEYDLASKMAKSPATAKQFVEGLIPKLQQKWEKEYEVLKQNLPPSVVLTPEGDFESFDIPFVMNQYKKAHLSIDETKIQEYFPVDATIQALFKIYESFFDITFEKYPQTEGLWHTDVTVLAVRNKADNVLLGHVVLDLFPRDGKYTHACHIGTVPAVLPGSVGNPDSTVALPALSIVLANFPKASGDRPALFLHSDVETFFHEFGHAIHWVMGRCETLTVSGTRVKRDFVELPSQMLEEWMWQPSILALVSQHFESKKPLDEELIKSKIKSRNAFSGRDGLRQLQFALTSLTLFSPEFGSQDEASMDSTAVLVDIQKRVMGHVKYNDETRFQCAFGHLMGYGASYYGYMWSEVFAKDVFHYIKEKEGLLDKTMGRRYVEHIIGPAGSVDPNVLLERFLGRPPSQEGFLLDLGVDPK